MATVTIRITNSEPLPLIVQVDPWAGVYRLAQGETIEFVAESETNQPEFHIEDSGRSRILTILHSDEYFVIRDGRRIHWTQCQATGFDQDSALS